MFKMLHMPKNKLTELLILAQDGDRIAYEHFLLECSKYLHLRLTKWTKRPEIIEEISQEILIGIHRNLHTFLPNRDAAAWVMGIARYKVIDFLRKNPHRFQELTFDVTKETEFSNNDVESSMEFFSDESFKEAWEDLPNLMRDALILTKVQGYSTKEAAQNLGIKENALRTRISRAISKLKKDLKQ